MTQGKQMVKVNLLLDNGSDYRSGFLNVDPFTPDNCTDGRVKGDVSNLSHVVDDGEASEIVALDILDYFPASMADAILDGWLSKLARGGTLTVGIIDIREVARGVVNDTLTADEVNDLLHGKQQKGWDARKSSFTLLQVAEVLKNKGYKVLAKRIQNYRAVVTVQRA